MSLTKLTKSVVSWLRQLDLCFCSVFTKLVTDWRHLYGMYKQFEQESQFIRKHRVYSKLLKEPNGACKEI